MANITKQEYKDLIATLVKMHNKGTYQNIPNRVTDDAVKKLLIKYEAHYNMILTHTVNKVHGAVNDGTILMGNKGREMIRSVEDALNSMNETIQANVENDLIKAHITGRVATTMAFLKEVELSAVEDAVKYASVNSHMVAEMVSDTMEDLLSVTTHTKKMVRDVIKDTFKTYAQYQAMTGENTANIKKLLEAELTKIGIKKKMLTDGYIGIVDKAGRKWKLKTYVDMAVTTKNHVAYVEGVKTAVKDYDTDIAKIPMRNSKDPCRHYEGMLISMNGDTEGYPSYAQLLGTGMVFHPRCRHSPVPVGDTDMLHKDDITHHNKQIEKLNKHVADEMPKKETSALADKPVKKKRGRPKKKLNYEQISFFN